MAVVREMVTEMVTAGGVFGDRKLVVTRAVMVVEEEVITRSSGKKIGARATATKHEASP